jgi:AcrR family transcriptional regulator
MTVEPISARAQLILTAKRLFAERGIDAVSLREVIREAGVTHVTAVQYHFGDRDGLITAVLAEHRARVDTRRDAMLEEYEANGGHDLRSIAAILVRPLAQELSAPQGRDFLRIYAEVIQRFRGEWIDTGSSIWRWRRHVDDFLPPGAAELHARFAALIFTTVELARRAAEDPSADDRLYVSHVIDIVAAMIVAPLSEETQRLQTGRATEARPHASPTAPTTAL